MDIRGHGIKTILDQGETLTLRWRYDIAAAGR